MQELIKRVGRETNLTAAEVDGNFTAVKIAVDTLEVSKADLSGLATVATSGSYNDLTNKPTISGSGGFNTDALYLYLINRGIYPLWNSKPILIVRVGDSLTENVADTDYENLLTGDYNVVNHGHGGTSTQQMLDTFAVESASMADHAVYSYCILLLGNMTNDANANYATAVSVENLRQLVVAGKTAGFDTIGVSTTTPNVNNPSNSFVSAANALLRQVWATWTVGGVPAVDVFFDVATVPELTDPSNLTYYNSDGTHLATAGKAKLVKGWVQALVPALVARHLPQPAADYSTAVGIPVAWVNTGGTVNGNTFTASSSSDKVYGTTAIGPSSLRVRGYLQFTIGAASDQYICGLSTPAQVPSAYPQINTAFIEGGMLRKFNTPDMGTSYAANDVVRIQIESDKVTYWKNGTKFDEVLGAVPSDVLLPDAGLFLAGSSIRDATIYAANPVTASVAA